MSHIYFLQFGFFMIYLFKKTNEVCLKQSLLEPFWNGHIVYWLFIKKVLCMRKTWCRCKLCACAFYDTILSLWRCIWSNAILSFAHAPRVWLWHKFHCKVLSRSYMKGVKGNQVIMKIRSPKEKKQHLITHFNIVQTWIKIIKLLHNYVHWHSSVTWCHERRHWPSDVVQGDSSDVGDMIRKFSETTLYSRSAIRFNLFSL